MAVSYVGKASGTASGSTFVATLPTGWAAGDVCYIVTFDTSNTNTATGWTGVQNGITTGSYKSTVLRRVLQTGDTAPTVSGSGSGDAWITMAFRNADALVPEDAQASTASQASSSSGVAPSVTASVPGDYLFCWYASTGLATGTPPGGATEILDSGGLMVNIEAIATPGATGTRTETFSSSSTSAAGSVLVKAAEGPPHQMANVAGVAAARRASVF